MLFGLWSVAKTIGLFLLQNQGLTLELEVTAQGDEQLSLAGVVVGVLFIVTDLALRLYVGRSAIAMSRGRKRSPLFIVLAILMVLASILTVTVLIAAIVVFHDQIPVEDIGIGKGLSTLVIEITSLVMMIELIYCSVRLRRLTGNGAY